MFKLSVPQSIIDIINQGGFSEDYYSMKAEQVQEFLDLEIPIPMIPDAILLIPAMKDEDGNEFSVGLEIWFVGPRIRPVQLHGFKLVRSGEYEKKFADSYDFSGVKFQVVSDSGQQSELPLPPTQPIGAGTLTQEKSAELDFESVMFSGSLNEPAINVKDDRFADADLVGDWIPN